MLYNNFDHNLFPQALHEEIFIPDRRDASCQTAKVSIQGFSPQVQAPPVVQKPIKVEKVKIIEKVVPPPQPNVVKTPAKSRISGKREPMVCDYCEQKFTTLENFEVHIRQTHGDQFSRSLFSCQICSQHYLSLEALYEHISCAHSLEQQDEEMGDQLCAYCADMMSSWQELASHLVSSHSVHMCKTCHVMCDTEQALELHVKNAHLTGIQPELLDEIPPPPRATGKQAVTENKPLSTTVTSSPSKKRGRPRKALVEEVYRKDLICSICNSRFPTEETLKKHIIYRHEPATKELMCKKCSLKFRRRSALENHMRIVHNTLELSDGEDDKSSIYILPDVKDENTTPALSPHQPQRTVLASPVQSQVKDVTKAAPVTRAGRIHCDVCGEMCSKPEDQEIHKDHHATKRMDRFLCLYCMG